MAAVRVIAFSSTLCGPRRAFMAPPLGSRSRRSSSGPIRRIDTSCSFRSSSVKSPDAVLAASFAAASASTLASTFSMSVITSPRPRIRDAMRSGWKGSKSSGFSPTPTNLIGFPVVVTTESAAPPRASPSVLVSTIPVSGERLGEAGGGLDRVLSGHRVRHEQRLLGLDRRDDRADLRHELLVDVEAPGRVHDDRVAAGLFRFPQSAPGDLDRIGELARRVDRHPDLRSERHQLLDGRRTREVGGDDEGIAAAPFQPPGELRGRGGLSGPLKTDQSDDRGFSLQVEPSVFAAEQGPELVAHDPRDLLSR